MANANAPFGFELVQDAGKETRVRYYKKAAGAAIYKGDLLILNATGDVSTATVGGQVVGVSNEYKAAADAGPIAVYADPETIFIAQASTFALADVGLNANIALGTPNATSKQSGQFVDAATGATTSTLQVKLIGLHERGTNAVGAYAVVKVKLNNHVMSAGTTGI